MDFGYAAEKFNAARRNLMLPHTRGVAASVADAFHECQLGLGEGRPDDLPNEDAARQLRELLAYMDTSDVPGESGRWQTKAEGFDTDDLIRVSSLVDQLSWWFEQFRDNRGQI